MKRILLVVLFLVSCLSLYRYAYSEDNLLALDTGFDKNKAVVPDKTIQKDETSDKTIKSEDQVAPDDVLQRRRGEEVLLLEAQLLAGMVVVVGIENFGNVLAC